VGEKFIPSEAEGSPRRGAKVKPYKELSCELLSEMPEHSRFPDLKIRDNELIVFLVMIDNLH